MKRWLKLTILRSAIGLAFLLVIYLVLALLPQHSAKQTIHNQLLLYATATNEVQAAQAALASIPSLSQVKLRQLGQVKSYSDAVQMAAAKTQALSSLQTAVPGPIFSFKLGANSQLIKDVNSLTASTRNQGPLQAAGTELAMVNGLLGYQAKVSAALVNLLEYDPVVDTKNFSLTSSDSQQRLKLAQAGLNKAKQDLQGSEGTEPDNSLSNIIAQIDSLLVARNHLANTGNTKDWIVAIELAQTKIVANRTAFWNKASNPATTRLSSSQASLSVTQQQWEKLDEIYRIN